MVTTGHYYSVTTLPRAGCVVDCGDNRFVNLRDVLNITNSKNRKKNINNKSGFNGVFWHKYNKLWVAKTRDCDRTVYLGSFKNLDAAIKARKNADIKYHFHPTHGKDI